MHSCPHFPQLLRSRVRSTQPDPHAFGVVVGQTPQLPDSSAFAQREPQSIGVWLPHSFEHTPSLQYVPVAQELLHAPQ